MRLYQAMVGLSALYIPDLSVIKFPFKTEEYNCEWSNDTPFGEKGKKMFTKWIKVFLGA